MPGILELYVTHAYDYVNGHVAANTTFHISRAKFELTIMRELDKSTLPIAYKLAWFNAVSTPLHLLHADSEQFVPVRILTSDFTTSFWLSVKIQHSLLESCIARYVPDSSLLSIEVPGSGIDEDPTTTSNRSRSLEPSASTTSAPEETQKTHHERSSSGVAGGGETESLKPTNKPEEVWHGNDRPEVLENDKSRSYNQRTKPRMSTGGKAPRRNAMVKARAKPNPAPKPRVEKPNPAPKRKTASKGEAVQASKAPKVAEGGI